MQLTIVKIGGNVIDDRTKLADFLKAFCAVDGYKILVHGGGKIATEIGGRLGIAPNYVNGRRVTDSETLNLVTMVYGGLINKHIVAALQALGCNAMGLTGADANLVPAVKRPAKEVDYGFVGDVNTEGINYSLIGELLRMGIVPVLAPLTHDGNGNMLNTNADTIAQEVAIAMAARMQVQLVYCFEKKGVLRDADDDRSVISTISESDFKQLADTGVVSGGMLPKLENALKAVGKRVGKVVIGHSDDLKELINGTAGTCIN